MHERRTLKRRHLIFHLRVYNRDTDQMLGYLVDITGNGVMLISEEPIEPELVLNLRMILPEEIFGLGQLDFVAKSLWCRKDINPQFYDTGFNMIDVSQDQLKVVNQMIDEYGFRD